MYVRRRALPVFAIAALIAALVVLVPSSPAAAMTPAPSTALDVDTNPLIGETINVGVTFENTSSEAVGFGPYVDLFTNSTGADGDDGVSFSAAEYLGQPVAAQTQTLLCDGTDTHPLTGLPVSCPPGIVAGDTVTVLTLPFGSFAPSQPPVRLVVDLDISNLADLDVPLTIATVGGFRFGADPLDDPVIDPPIVQPSATLAAVSPTVMTLEKFDNAPESETATGENFRRSWSVNTRLAPGQSVTDVTLSDELPSTVVFDGFDSSSPAGGVTTGPSTAAPQLPPDNVASVTWSAIASDAEMTFGFWVPELDANGDPVLDPETGAAAVVANDASVTATWAPLDPRDPPTTFTLDPAGPEDTITARSLATQKSVQIVSDVGSPGASPGDTLEWTIAVQVSDYFTFDMLEIADLFSDGQSLDTAFTPTLTVATPDGSGPVSNFADHVSSTVDACASAEPGAISWTADLSAALAEEFPASVGRFVGGEGVGPTTATMKVRTVIDSDYRCPVGAPSVNSGDRITNDVAVAGAVIDAGGVPKGSTVTDVSSAGVTIVSPDLTKGIYALNGDTLNTGPEITSGDVVTYRLRSTLPLTNVFDTALTDFLPLPTFDIPGAGFTQDFAVPQAPGPFVAAPWSIVRGPDDTFTGVSAVTGADPLLSVDQVNNSFTLEYPNYQAAPGDSAAVIDLLVNVVVSDQRFADGLFLTNQVDLRYSDSYSTVSSEAAIVQVQLTEPRLQISKGVVSTDRTPVTFSPSQVGPAGLTWSVPGDTGTRFSGGPVTSASLASGPVSSSVSGLDVGDTATFALVVENVGAGVNGAFDVQLADVLPVGFVEPAAGWNVGVTDGQGNPLSFVTDPGPGPLGASITLVDPPTAGALAPFSETSGANVAVVTFDATMAGDVSMASTYTNIAEVASYSGSEAGPNFVTTPIVDTAAVTTRFADFVKSIIETQMVPGVIDAAPRSTLTIGSLVTYQVAMTVPEGETDAVTLVDTLQAGLAIVSVDSIDADPAVSTSRAGGFNEVLSSAVVSSVGTGVTALGRRVTFDFATLRNSDTDNDTPEVVNVELTAVVLNVAANTPITTTTRNNGVRAFASGSVVSPSRNSPAVTIVGPRLTTDKVADVATADAGDTVNYEITLTATSTPRVSDAYDVVLSDVLPDGVTLVPGSFTHTAGVAPSSFDGAASPLSANWDSLAPGESSTFTYSVTVDADASSFGANAVNTATTRWTSQPGDPGSQSSFNTLGVQRTGSTADVGGIANNYTKADTAAVTVNSAGISKAITATSAAHTAGSNVTIGETVTYALTIGLPEGDLGEVVVTDLLPAGLLYVPGSVSVDTSDLSGSLGTVSTTTAGNNVVTTFSDVIVDATPSTADNVVVVSLTATVADIVGNSAGTVLNNVGRVTVAGSQFDSSPVPVTVVVPNLVVAKSVTPTAAVGDTVTYSFEVTNTGGSQAFDVTLSDLVDSDVLNTLDNFVTSASWAIDVSPSGDDTVVSWFSADGLAPGASVTFGFTAVVSSDIVFPGSHTNTATVEGSSLPGSPTEARTVDDDDDATFTFTAVDIAVDKVADVTNADAGDTITYTITVSNDGTRNADGVVLVDTLGDHVSFVSSSGAGVHDAGEVTWPAFDLAAGASSTFTVTAAVVDPLPVGAAVTVNVAEAADDGSHGPDSDPSNNADTATVTLAAEVDLELSKSTERAVVEPGDTISYEVEVTNLGARDAEGATVVDTLGADLVFVSASDGGVWDPDARTITWTGVDVGGSGDSVIFEVVAEVSKTVPAGTESVTNSATVSHPDDVNPDNDTDSVDVTVDAYPDLSITKTNNTETIIGGQTVTYEIEVLSSGNRGASGVTVVDTLPAEVEFDSASSAGVYDPVAHTVTWNLGVMESFSNVGLAVTVTALDPMPEGTVSVTNTVTVTDDGTNGDDPTPENNTASDTDVTGADLVVTKTSTGDTLTPGAPAEFMIAVANNGPEMVTEIVIDDTYPTGLTSPVFVPSAGDFDPVTMLWAGLMLAPGDTVVLTVTFDVSLDAAGGLTNVASAAPVGPTDPTPGDATSEVTVPVVPVVDLELSKELVGELVRGDVASYRLTVLNRGPSIATDVVVIDQLPAELSFEGASGDGWVCDLTSSAPDGSSEVSCALSGPLAPGEEASFRLSAMVAADATGEIVNRASVSAAETNTGGDASVASASAELPPLPSGPTPPAPPPPPAPQPGPAPTPVGALALTGSDPWSLLLFALALFAVGALLRRRGDAGQRRAGLRTDE